MFSHYPHSRCSLGISGWYKRGVRGTVGEDVARRRKGEGGGGVLSECGKSERHCLGSTRLRFSRCCLLLSCFRVAFRLAFFRFVAEQRVLCRVTFSKLLLVVAASGPTAVPVPECVSRSEALRMDRLLLAVCCCCCCCFLCLRRPRWRRMFGSSAAAVVGAGFRVVRVASLLCPVPVNVSGSVALPE